jgi:hypothetical protein
MSSKAERKRAEFLERERKRKQRDIYMQPWKCPSCGRKCVGGFPVCLCGYIRKIPK